MTPFLFPRLALAFVLSLSMQPSYASPNKAYFESLSEEFTKSGFDGPTLFIDMDRLDHNLDQIKSVTDTGFSFRATTKSLPSVGLLRYILRYMNSNKVMAFHPNLMRSWMGRLTDESEILMGKTVPPQSLKNLRDKIGIRKVRKVIWLIDSIETFRAWEKFFREENEAYQVALEIDVGMKRGGPSDVKTFSKLLTAVITSPSKVTLRGLMGYDGHVVHLPIPEWAGLKRAVMDLEHGWVQERYQEFVEVIEEQMGLRAPTHLMGPNAPTQQIYNSGGSSTVALFKNLKTPVNDLAMGSGILKPQDFDLISLKKHQPAVFVGAPILKVARHASIPILGTFTRPFYKLFRPSLRGYWIMGGGWNSEVEYPRDFSTSRLMSKGPNRNLIPNQSFVYGVIEPEKKPGDWIFFRPLQSDILMQFDRIVLIRNRKVMAQTWKPFSGRL